MDSEKHLNEDVRITVPDMEIPGNTNILDKNETIEPHAEIVADDSKNEMDSEKHPNENVYVTVTDTEGPGNMNTLDKIEDTEQHVGTAGDDCKQMSVEVRKNNPFNWLRIVVNIATVITAIVALFTLIEMRIERNNAYKPEIVIKPDTFEGGENGTDELELDKQYIIINYSKEEPWLWYSGYSTGDVFQYSDGPDESVLKDRNDQGYLYLEAPYLTLKNIGKGTAKNVSITFSTDWAKDMVISLNDNLRYYLDDNYQSRFYIINDDILCGFIGYDGTMRVAPIGELSIYLSYISFDEEDIHIVLPEFMYALIATLFAKTARAYDFGDSQVNEELQVPDLNVTIQYTDIQGKPYKHEEVIPWNAYYRSAAFDNEKHKILLKTSFYDNYVR